MKFYFTTTLYILFALSLLSAYPSSLFAQTGSVDLVWEADAYTPPFYKGKALYPPQGDVRVIAIPHIAGVSPSTLSYKWSIDGTVLGSKSGVGKTTLFIEGSLLSKNLPVAVEVTRSDESVVGQAFVDIVPIDPIVRLYRHDPALGTLFNRALGQTVLLSDEELRVDAYPFFFSGSNRDTQNPTWTLNGRSVEATNGPFGLTLRRGESSGFADVTFSLQNMVQILQRAQESFRIEF